MKDDLDFAEQREYMIENQLKSRDVRDARVLEAMRHVPRHEFVSPEYYTVAYADGPLPIGNGQTISQPYIVALMSQLLELTGNEVVLEIGTGSGYQAAVLAELAQEVYTIERHASLGRSAKQILTRLGYDNVHVHIGDGSKGLPDFAPYDGILATAAAPQVPQPLLKQLKDGGRLVIPVGSRGNQFLERWRRSGDRYKREDLIPVAFVPLIGDQGWRD